MLCAAFLLKLWYNFYNNNYADKNITLNTNKLYVIFKNKNLKLIFCYKKLNVLPFRKLSNYISTINFKHTYLQSRCINMRCVYVCNSYICAWYSDNLTDFLLTYINWINLNLENIFPLNNKKKKKFILDFQMPNNRSTNVQVTNTDNSETRFNVINTMNASMAHQQKNFVQMV